MKRNIVTIIITIILVVAVLVVVFLNFGKYKENELSKYYDIIEERIVESEKRDNLKDYKTFIEMDKYGSKEEENKLYIYAYVAVENYYKDDNGNVILDSGFSIPHRFEFENDEYVGYKIPQDGSYYKESLEEMYPVNIRMKMDFSDAKYNLSDNLKQQAAQYYNVEIEEIKTKK